MDIIKDITDEIYRVETIEELKKIDAVVKARWKELENDLARAFRKDDKVSWISRSRKYQAMTITGKVTRVNVTSVSVIATNGVHWTVSPQLLSKV